MKMNAKTNVKLNRKKCCAAVCLLVMFAAWTVLLRLVDVKAIGPMGSSVGFATLNECVHRLTGTNLFLYTITDWLGLIPLATVLGFAILGLWQWIKRKKLWCVDGSILALGTFYIAVMAVFVFFEVVVINYRPVLINGILEASYPSSTTLLVMCVMPTAGMQLRTRIKNRIFRQCVSAVIFAFVTFMVVGRILSGVHWITDIIGGAMLSAALVIMYTAVEEGETTGILQKEISSTH